jgi:hypothetical protein
MRRSLLLLLITSLLLLLSFPVKAEIPRLISYQGKVTDSGGMPVTDGTYTMRFRIYDAETAGTLEWDSGAQSAELSGGVFSILLGESPMTEVYLNFDEDYWLLVTFDGVDQTPRQRLTSCGYAYMASGIVPGTIVSASIPGLPESVLKVHNTATTGETYGLSARHDSPSGTAIIATAVASSGENRGIYGRSYSSEGTGIYGYASANSGTNYGIVGRSDSNSGRGVYGEAIATSGTTFGGYFKSSSSSGRGVYGWVSDPTGVTYGGKFENVSTSGRGVYGKAYAGTGTTYGGYFESSSSSGRAVFGYATATTNTTTYGGKFESKSQTGRGVYGYASHTSGASYGGKFDNSSTNGVGVAGYATATTGLALGGYFESASSSGTGVRGIATSTTGETYGVLGRSYSTTDNSRGVYGRSYATSGVTYGVYGRSDSGSDDAVGVFGYSSATGAITCGVYGQSDSWYGTGVQGYGPLAGVWGIATGGVSGSGTGVFGEGPLCGAQFDDTNSSASAAVASDTYKIVGTGAVSFMQNHPYDDDRVIVYAAPEGDEVATYTRGTARLIDGSARVLLGETFKWVTNPDIGLTAHLTPRGRCDGLYVESLTTEEMIVREQRDGSSGVTFDYIVYGLRIGFEEQTIVQEKKEEAFIPSMTSHRERCTKDPGLRKFTALERFKAMYVGSGVGEALDLSAFSALRDAVQEYDPGIHGKIEIDVLSGLVGEGSMTGLEEEPAYPQREEEKAADEENEWR